MAVPLVANPIASLSHDSLHQSTFKIVSSFSSSPTHRHRPYLRHGCSCSSKLERRCLKLVVMAAPTEEQAAPVGDEDDSARGPTDPKAHETKQDSEDAKDNLSKQNLQESEESLKVESGSPLPGIKPPSDRFRMPKHVLDTIRDQVLGFDTFFATSQEDYEGGVIFRGNLRGDPIDSHAKMLKRLQDKFSEDYELFLMIETASDKPVVIVVPKTSLQSEAGAVPEWFAATAFGLVTAITAMFRNSSAAQLNILVLASNPKLLLDGLPGGLIVAFIMLAHEAGHIYSARQIKAELGLPFFVPSLQLGSFGAITRIKGILKTRGDLIRIAASGPLVGSLVALTIILVGLLLPPAEGQGVLVDASVFHESLLVGGLAKLIFGDSLKEGATLALNPLILPAWLGLLINAINSIPVGDLDGGRIAHGLWGRKVWSRVTGVCIGLLGVAGIFNDVSLYWVVLIVFLQRGPIFPQAQEVSSPDSTYVVVGALTLMLGLCVYLPFPLQF